MIRDVVLVLGVLTGFISVILGFVGSEWTFPVASIAFTMLLIGGAMNKIRKRPWLN